MADSKKEKTMTVSETLASADSNTAGRWTAALYRDKTDKPAGIPARFTAEEVLCILTLPISGDSASTVRTRTFFRSGLLKLSVPGIQSDLYASLSEEKEARLKLLHSDCHQEYTGRGTAVYSYTGENMKDYEWAEITVEWIKDEKK